MSRANVIQTENATYCGQCRHKVHWWTQAEVFDPKNIFEGLESFSDVVERPCPHGNGTVIEHCPKCDTQVGIWGVGIAGGMECDCWDARAWYMKVYDWTIGRLVNALRGNL